MFGRNIGGALGVTEEQWNEFVASEISPRFPDGLSIDDALGEWRDLDTSAVIKEPSKDVTLIVPQDAEVKEKIDAIITAYEDRFKQQAIGRRCVAAGLRVILTTSGRENCSFMNTSFKVRSS
jgi:hypothetical protein